MLRWQLFYSRLGCLLRENATSMRVQSTHKALDYLGHGIEKQVSGLITRLVAKLIFIPWKAILAGYCILVEFFRNWFIRKHQVSHHWDVHWQQFRGTWGIRGHSRSGQVYFSFYRHYQSDIRMMLICECCCGKNHVTCCLGKSIESGVRRGRNVLKAVKIFLLFTVWLATRWVL